MENNESENKKSSVSIWIFFSSYMWSAVARDNLTISSLCLMFCVRFFLVFCCWFSVFFSLACVCAPFELKYFFLSPNFYFRVHSTNEKGKKEENLFCHCVESPNVTYKRKVYLYEFWSDTNRFYVWMLRKTSMNSIHCQFGVLWQENWAFARFPIARRWQRREWKKNACLAAQSADTYIQDAGNNK